VDKGKRKGRERRVQTKKTKPGGRATRAHFAHKDPRIESKTRVTNGRDSGKMKTKSLPPAKSPQERGESAAILKLRKGGQICVEHLVLEEVRNEKISKGR